MSKNLADLKKFLEQNLLDFYENYYDFSLKKMDQYNRG